MRRGKLVLAVGLISSLAAAADPPLPKEGTSSYLNALSGTVKAMPIGKDRVQLAYDVMGVSLSDTGEGLLHNASVRCLGGMLVVNGAFEDEAGSCVYTRPDGDQAFTTYRASGKPGVAAKGTYSYVGGTGKLAGMSGGGEFTRYNVRPAAEGTSQSVTRGKGTFRLP